MWIVVTWIGGQFDNYQRWTNEGECVELYGGDCSFDSKNGPSQYCWGKNQGEEFWERNKMGWTYPMQWDNH